MEIAHAENSLPTPSIEQLVTVKAKTGRPKILSDENCNTIFAACTVNKKARKKQ